MHNVQQKEVGRQPSANKQYPLQREGREFRSMIESNPMRCHWLPHREPIVQLLVQRSKLQQHPGAWMIHFACAQDVHSWPAYVL